MSLTTTTHLNFPGTARQALDFYQSVFGGQVHATSYAEVGMPQDAPDAQKTVFGALNAENGVRLMAYDIPGRSDSFTGGTRREQGMTITDQPFFVSLGSDSLDELSEYWEKLADNAEIIEPLAASQWSAGFGMLTDQFGVTWTLSVVTG